MPIPSALRSHRALAGALLAVLAGCQAAPGSSTPDASYPDWKVAGGGASVLRPTPGPGSLDGAASTPSPAASPTEAPPLLELPAPSLDSDLEPEDQEAVVDLLNSDRINLYLPSDLIHDGGVILYQTLNLLALGDRLRDAVAANGANADASAADVPSAWKRQDVERGGRQTQLRRNLIRTTGTKATKEANVRVRYPMRGTLAYKDPQRGVLLRKAFAEEFERDLSFELVDNAWRLASYSPIRIESRGGASGITFKQVAVYQGEASAPLFRLASGNQMTSVEAEPVVKTADQLRIEVTVGFNTEKPPLLYTRLVGKNDNNRQALYDDGTHGDRTAGDGIYSAKLVVPTTGGLRHLAIDAVDAKAFTPGGLYRASSVGMSFLVKSE